MTGCEPGVSSGVTEQLALPVPSVTLLHCSAPSVKFTVAFVTPLPVALSVSLADSVTGSL